MHIANSINIIHLKLAVINSLRIYGFFIIIKWLQSWGFVMTEDLQVY